ncbi:hypothetical protein C1645_809841 [Glomus cerebriforme]|uniref:HMG box domain-containing protein n=1 Tax=Glomus cerebriforme TaxID=658196 RepID=A0A397S6D2_9GLOM|nr:hypothetical protein C1645_809841 [Glomus cerebriforme]
MNQYMYMHSLPQTQTKNIIIEQVLSEVDPLTREKISKQILVPIEKLLCPKKKSRSGNIPRPQNSFVIYRRDFMTKLESDCGHEVSSDLSFVSKKASKWWASESPEVKNIYQIIADLARKVHNRTYPEYVFQPKKRRATKYMLNDCYSSPQQNQNTSISPSPSQLISSAIQPINNNNNNNNNNNYYNNDNNNNNYNNYYNNHSQLPSINYILPMDNYDNYDRRMCRSLRGPY